MGCAREPRGVSEPDDHGCGGGDGGGGVSHRLCPHPEHGWRR